MNTLVYYIAKRSFVYKTDGRKLKGHVISTC